MNSFELEKYLEDLLPPRDPLLLEMERVALAETIPVVTPAVGHFLQQLVLTSQATSILEIGTAIGYSTLYLAQGLAEQGAGTGSLVTIDMNLGRLSRAEGYLERAGLTELVEFVGENALHYLPRCQRQFDLVFMDAAKGEYPQYLELVLPRIGPKGLLVIDNVLFRGWVVPGAHFDDKYDQMVKALRDFLARVAHLPGYETSILPMGDGLAIARRKT